MILRKKTHYTNNHSQSDIINSDNGKKTLIVVASIVSILSEDNLAFIYHKYLFPLAAIIDRQQRSFLFYKMRLQPFETNT